jgi:transcriptional regulator with PAS, ATPase and Fis domain
VSVDPSLFDGDPRMRAIRSIIESIADTDTTVLIRGESGVGKDLIARMIHSTSTRRGGPFIKVNCAAIPSGLLESELFGHEKRAFTGARRRKFGQFEYADRGTIYLDEVAEIPLALQGKLLHALQDRRFTRVGGHDTIDVGARVIAATNRDLEAAMARGEFREDLYYRINVVEIRVPPLRERLEEIPSLVAWFLAKFNAQYGRRKELSAEMIQRLQEYSWPGNVRELENVIRRWVVLTDVEQAVEALLDRPRHSETAARHPEIAESLREIARRGAREAERQALAEVLDRVRWNRAKAARILKVSYKTLLNKIVEVGINDLPRDSGRPSRPDPGVRSLFDRDPRMRVIRPIVQTDAASDNPVLIHGERAVDRDLVARAIHAMSPRRDGPFVKLNCAAIAPELLESELFGSETDVFTGRHQRNPGQFENANKGTIFLDEIADLPLALQAKLLHMLRERRRTRTLGFWSLGSRGMIHVDTRVIAATNRDLEEAMRRGEFREELYYRLNVAEIRVPPPPKEDDGNNDAGPDQPTVPRHPVPVEAGGRLGRLKVRESY